MAIPLRNTIFDKIKEAIECFQNKSTWMRIMSNGMKSDFSWDKSAMGYIDLFESILKAR